MITKSTSLAKSKTTKTIQPGLNGKKYYEIHLRTYVSFSKLTICIQIYVQILHALQHQNNRNHKSYVILFKVTYRYVLNIMFL